LASEKLALPVLTPSQIGAGAGALLLGVSELRPSKDA
jgi:hypothetical protein